MVKTNKNICVATWYNALNYGTCLQSYALVKVLINNGYNAYIPETLKYYYYDFMDHPIVSAKRIIELISKKPAKKFNKLDSEYQIRQKKINDFADKYNNIYKIKSYSDYKQLQKDSDIYITGSDQIWNPYIIREAFLLTFVKDNKKKVAYASSIGVEKIPDFRRKLYKRALSKFYEIGVREKSAQKELSELLNKDITNVLDPTYLLAKEDWENILTNNLPIEENKNYIFCYFVGENQDWVDDIKKLSHKIELPVHIVTSEARIVPNVGVAHADFGVEEFLTAIHNAKYVITDSFHAIAFSVIFNKNFAVYKRFKDTDKSSQNSRIYDILNLFGLENRLVSSYEDLKILNIPVEYEKVNNIIKQEREKSLNFLLEALKENE